LAELLDPIPNAVAALRAADAAARAAHEQGVQDPAGEVQVAGYHHHHRYRYRHHHHHSHHHRAVIVVPGVRIGVGRAHHHHHHHHNNYYYRGY
jgi:G3E family GTPase